MAGLKPCPHFNVRGCPQVARGKRTLVGPGKQLERPLQAKVDCVLFNFLSLLLLLYSRIPHVESYT